MKYSVILSPQAREQFHGLCAYDRAKVRDAIDEHLQHAPMAESRSRIKRLRDLKKPQYRLRADNIRIFYDVEKDQVIVLGIVEKAHADQWLAEAGETK
ncbi:MAG: type II toxin-antitoxin system RelE/ParE family toxin [Kiritimatiellia bacterium]